MIQFEKSLEMTVVITDVSGRIVYQEYHAQNDKTEIDLANELATGTYFLTILDTDAQLIHTQKIQLIR